nr:MAG TPA: hypothetical protein [Caudoviricetes sp.]
MRNCTKRKIRYFIGYNIDIRCFTGYNGLTELN